MKIASIAFVVLAATSSAATAQNLLKDSSFETPVIAEGSLLNVYPGQKIGAWNVVGSSPSFNWVTLVSGTYPADGITFNAHSGKQYLSLTGGNNGGGCGTDGYDDSGRKLHYHALAWERI
jgi:hypothetical protein